jgi:hypothetical protein
MSYSSPNAQEIDTRRLKKLKERYDDLGLIERFYLGAG